ncbi:DUF2059 domain-containing protein [Erythrobacter sp. GH3-10]|uniref:DUF2059 domain-containing protein n=2 Tax=Aurantiacibacter rhizosphaerae TaxID=2691582 RepID=A0A844XDT7_9SPHN|nr:DUF2059 domain-containing protein [Aurantiacibacter rhizosphaerae]
MMIRKTAFALFGAATLALSPVAAIAQDDPDMEQLAMLGTMFEVEPLTPEQEARLPMARGVVEKILPEGAMMEVMGSAFNGVLGPILEMTNEDEGAALQGALGYAPEELAIGEDASAEILKMIDPAWRERNQAISTMTQTMMSDMMTRMEPIMRNVMSELYAIHFTQEELVDIDGFFSTPSGLSYARQSYAMAGDPRIMAAMFSEPDLLFGSFAQMPAMMEEALADVPQMRSYAELSETDRARLMKLTGLSAEALEEAMQAAAETSAIGM